VIAYQLVPVGVTIPLADVDPPGLIVPRLVADPQVLPLDWQIPLHSVVVDEHVHVKPAHTPLVGGMHAVPAGWGRSGGHDTLAELHDWLVSHTPEAVWHTFVSTLDGHATLAELHDVVASHTPIDVWQMLVSTLDGHVTLAELHDVVASHAPADVWHTFVSTLDGHDTLDELHDTVASHTPADV
jgi:hypothetical protein